MRSFLNELRIIPPVTWPLALLTAGGAFWMFAYYWAPRDPYMRQWSPATLMLFACWSALFAFGWALMVGYVHADAKRRGMRYIMWTLLTIFIQFLIGFILYFVLRDPLLIHCPKCGATGRSGYIFCPECGAELAPSCPNCRRAVEVGWKRCVYCGIELDPIAVKSDRAAARSG